MADGAVLVTVSPLHELAVPTRCCRSLSRRYPRKLSFTGLRGRVHWMWCVDRLSISPDLGSCGYQAIEIQLEKRMNSHKHSRFARTSRAHLVNNERHAGVDGSREGILRLLQEQGETEPAMSAFRQTMVAALWPNRW